MKLSRSLSPSLSLSLSLSLSFFLSFSRAQIISRIMDIFGSRTQRKVCPRHQSAVTLEARRCLSPLEFVHVYMCVCVCVCVCARAYGSQGRPTWANFDFPPSRRQTSRRGRMARDYLKFPTARARRSFRVLVKRKFRHGECANIATGSHSRRIDHARSKRTILVSRTLAKSSQTNERKRESRILRVSFLRPIYICVRMCVCIYIYIYIYLHSTPLRP